MANHTRAWGATYEALPASSGEAASLGASRIRDLKLDIRERMAVDHIWNDNTTTGSEDGEHTKVTLEQRSAPSQLTDKIILYAFDYNNGSNTRAELYAIDEDGNIIRLTDRGAMAILKSNNSWTKGQATTEYTLTDAATIAIDASQSNSFKVTLAASRTLGLPTNGKSGQVITIRFIQDGTGSRVLTTAGQGFYGSSADDLTLSTAANSIDLMTLYYDGTSWYILGLKKSIQSSL